MAPSEEKKRRRRYASEEITARRLRLLSRAALNDHLISKTINDLAKEMSCSEDTLRDDWRRRRIWAPKILEMKPAEAEDAFIRLFNQWHMLANTLLMIGVDSENYRAIPRVMALRALTDSICREIEKRQSLGYLPKMPEKLEVTEQGDLTKLLADFKDLEPLCRGEVKRLLSEINAGDDPNKPVHKDDTEPKADSVPLTPPV